MTRRRADYLKAMGIELWQRRVLPAPETAPEAVPEITPEIAPEPEITELANELTSVEETASVDVMSEHNSAPPPATGSEPLPLDPDDRTSRIAAMDWPELVNEVENCQACPLHNSRTRAVFGVGNRQADWMIIGEAPGADEDRLGEPFVGRAGKLLDLMLHALHLKREDIFIANILKSRPPNNRDPAADEVQACWPYLARQVELVAPKIILAMGRVAAQNLLQSNSPVGRMRNKVHYFGSREIPLIVTYHPAYLLRSPREKRKSWDDLCLARQTLANTQ